ncbi:Polysaccharide lyase family 8, N terminal alpha-helical domain [Rhizoctonia solani]|uniref:Polysaccharide lyase family 8, N terminal alpha-helical domain n=1 Tax=Rhizoctonia solani TaxID=456999 RepID=A0A8H7LI38_9AGAM|nr:Polysaccharide lyase family 8, N terminal alpha-helical domain [Rhizoctonia solani]
MLFRQLLVAAVAALKLELARGQASDQDIRAVYERRLPFIVASSLATPQLVEEHLNTLSENGTWPTVNYATGCDAQRANWPAGIHWNRILILAAAYHGGVNGAEQYVKNPTVRDALSRAMGYWFANDFGTVANGACLDRGGQPAEECPCGTPGLWNTNWYSNVILVPTQVGKTCLLLGDELTPTEYGNCTAITTRAYAPFYRNPPPGFVSGANIIDMASIGISAGLLENNRTGNASRIMDAYERVHNETVVHEKDFVDGIKPDGSFQQHIGIVYDGNYGKDFSNSLLEMELQAADTAFQPNQSVKDAFSSHIGGAQWMTFADTKNNTLHWDYTVIGRMIAFAIADDQASANLKMNLTRVQELGNAWNSTELQKFATDLSKPIETANAGFLTGNRMFWNSDYMVHRTNQTVTTLRMLSNRTKTSECVNTQNPFGFHLSDGAMYQYSNGQEYLDIYATFDWNLVPGTTVDYNATVLNCSATEKAGVTTYAGGVSAGDVGVAAMEYTNPTTRGLSFKKAWFFFKHNVQHVLVNGVSSTSSAPVYSVLDQRLHKGPVYVDGEKVSSGNYCDVDSIWHAGTGYIFPESQGTEIRLEAEKKTGSWKNIGTSVQGNVTKDMFSASIVHDQANLGTPIEYSIFPATNSHEEFEDKAEWAAPRTIINDGTVSAAIDYESRTLGAAFWNVGGGSVRVPEMGLTVYADRPLTLVLKLTSKEKHSGSVSIADPTHGSGPTRVRLVWSTTTTTTPSHPECKRMLGHAGSRRNTGSHRCTRHTTTKETLLEFDLPGGGLAGSGVTQEFKQTA